MKLFRRRPAKPASMSLDVVRDEQDRGMPDPHVRASWTLLEMLPEEWERAVIGPAYDERGEYQGVRLVLLWRRHLMPVFIREPAMLVESPEMRERFLAVVRAEFRAAERE